MRNTRFIELGNKYDALNPEIKNEISDLSPLSIEYINRINPSSDDVLKWFKNKSNLEIQLGGESNQKLWEMCWRLTINIWR